MGAVMDKPHVRRNWLRTKDIPTVIAGPCSVESEEQLLETAKGLAASGKVDIIRGGIWKPRTRPGTFEGIGVRGLPWMKKVKAETGLPVTVEAAKAGHAEMCLEFEIDIIWIGARTTVNPFAVQEVAEALRGTNIPVLIKNPIHPDLSLWLGAVERFEKVGIKNIGVIHRGFSNAGEKVYRNRPMWQLAIEFMGKRPDLPMVCDPSHICGRRDLLADVSQKAVDLNFDGLMIESHRDPDNAWSDAKQQITPTRFGEIVTGLKARYDKENDEKVQHSLDYLRAEIKEIDMDILNLLVDRMKVARKIGVYKKANDMTILQPKRWEEITSEAMNKGQKAGLSEDFINRYLQAVHDESIDQQEKVMMQE
jgi:chorismate mutase